MKLTKNITFRYPTKNDLKAVWEYINTISKEQTFILFQGEEITWEMEAKWLEGELKKIIDKKSVQIFAFAGDKLIGVSGITMKDRAEKHIGVFGITLAKNFRNKGIGKTLMEKVLKEAKKNLTGLKIIDLGVFGDNPIAKSLYEKRGFVEYGRLPKGILHKGKFVDHIYMYKEI
ncbi:GNAT family N-acetyltransferase [Candidatus Daviesbacteria bacterium]|nr:GNAT family N-acetyltransferase [Candidatus Daviesbacteria bacterium]